MKNLQVNCITVLILLSAFGLLFGCDAQPEPDGGPEIRDAGLNACGHGGFLSNCDPNVPAGCGDGLFCSSNGRTGCDAGTCVPILNQPCESDGDCRVDGFECDRDNGCVPSYGAEHFPTVCGEGALGQQCKPRVPGEDTYDGYRCGPNLVCVWASDFYADSCLLGFCQSPVGLPCPSSTYCTDDEDDHFACFQGECVEID